MSKDAVSRLVRRRSSLPSSDAVRLLLFGLLRSGAVKLRALDYPNTRPDVEGAA
jgi:hypothetical protein